VDEQREQLLEVDTVAARARLDLLDELTGALDAAIQGLDLVELAAVGQRAQEANVSELADAARAAWFDVRDQLVDQEQQRGQG
jgi:hypothetical protein